MGRDGKGRPKVRGGRGFLGHGVRGSSDDRWDPEGQDRVPGRGLGREPERELERDHDPGRDLRDLYEDLQDPAGDESIWPGCGDEDED